MKKDVIIIGGGLGGLFTGAMLAKEGYVVTVLEKNHTIGGGLQTFYRNGESFETGMHILGGLRPGGSVHKICHYLGILDRLSLRDVDADCMDAIHYMSDGVTYRIAEGRDGFINSLVAHFPDEREGLERYTDAIYRLSEEVDLFYLRPGDSVIMSHSDEFLYPVGKFISQYIKNEKLQDILAYMNPMYGGVKEHTPAYIHALINVLYINGANRFAGGSLQLAEALKWVIESNGGRVLAGTTVERIEVIDRNVVYVEAKRKRYSADHYISAIHPCSMLKLVNEGAFPNSFIRRLNDIPNAYSAFTVYLTLKKDVFPYINHTCYCIDDYGQAWSLGDTENWPRGFMYMTPPEENQGEFSSKLIITSPMSFELVREWENTTVGNRGEPYNAWKRQQADKLIAKLTKIHPCLSECIESVNASSPLTIRDYYNVKDGSMYGFQKDCDNIAMSQILVFTKVRNLLLTGQNINLHGICGTPLTAINTAEGILGLNYLIEKINKSYKTYSYEPY